VVFLTPLQFVHLFCNLSKCVLLFFSCISSGHSRRKLRGMFALSANTVRNTNHVRMRTLLGYISMCVSILGSRRVAPQHISTISAQHPMGTKCNST
jgi:hypothetical protein